MIFCKAGTGCGRPQQFAARLQREAGGRGGAVCFSFVRARRGGARGRCGPGQGGQVLAFAVSMFQASPRQSRKRKTKRRTFRGAGGPACKKKVGRNKAARGKRQCFLLLFGGWGRANPMGSGSKGGSRKRIPPNRGSCVCGVAGGGADRGSGPQCITKGSIFVGGDEGVWKTGFGRRDEGPSPDVSWGSGQSRDLGMNWGGGVKRQKRDPGIAAKKGRPVISRSRTRIGKSRPA